MFSGKCNLHTTVRETMYKSVMQNLFGEETFPTDDRELFQEIEKNFVLFDEFFDYGAKLPPFFIK